MLFRSCHWQACQHLVAVIRKPVETPANGIANSFGNDAGPPGVFGDILQRNVSCYLTNKKRVAIGAIMYGFRSFKSQIYPRATLDQLPHLLLGQSIKLHSVEQLLPDQSAKGLGQRMAPGNLDVAVRADQQQSAGPNLPGQKLQK